MKRLTVIALLASAIAFTGCKKAKDENKPATTENKPAAGTAAGTAAPAAGTAAPAAGTAAPAAGTAAPAGDMAGTAPAAGTAAPAAGGAAPTDAEFDAMMGKAIAMFDSMGKAVDAAGDDCGKLADGMSKVFDDNKDFMESAKKWKDNPEMDKKAEEWMKANMDKVMPSMMKVGQAGTKCASDAKFAEVMKRMDELK